MNRPLRTRTVGGVVRAGEKPALTRLGVGAADERKLVRMADGLDS